MDTSIIVKDLKKHFGQTKAVDGISFTVNKGEIFGFLGPNGAGKTTTIRCMMNILHPTTGSITLLGRDAHKDSAALKKDIGFLSGDVHLYRDWTGQEHLNLFAQIRGMSKGTPELLRALNFDPAKRVKNMSSGNRQKLGLILALMHEPKIVMLDEPTSGLDPLLQNTLYSILKQLAREGVTVFMSSHNLSEVERICSRVCIIKEGRVAATKKVSELRDMRQYRIEVYFEKAPSEKELQIENVTIEKKLRNGFLLNVSGEIEPLLEKLNQYVIQDIQITHATLEDIFMTYYA